MTPKYSKIYALLLLLLTLVLAACSETTVELKQSPIARVVATATVAATNISSTSPNPTPTISSAFEVSSYRISGIALRDDTAMVTAKLGKPSNITVAHGLGTPLWEYNGISVTFWGNANLKKDVVMRIVLTKSEAGTIPEQLRVGATKAEVERIFGPVNFIAPEGSIRRELSKDISLDLEYKSNLITAIVLTDQKCTTC